MTTRALSGRWRWTHEGTGAIPVGNAAAETDGTGGYAGPREQARADVRRLPRDVPSDYCTVCGFKASPITRTGTSFCLDHAIEDYARNPDVVYPALDDEPRFPRTCPCGQVFYVRDPRVRMCRKTLCPACLSERNLHGRRRRE
jgi:hypothetical protein